MEELELNDELLGRLKEYMIAKQSPYNTIRTYGYQLDKLFRESKILSQATLPKMLAKRKHDNQRAIFNLINRYCFDNNIPFRVILPKISKKRKKMTVKVLPLEEIEIIIKSAPKPYDLFLKCIFKIGGGLRISEGIRLGWSHFNWHVWLHTRGAGKVKIVDSKGDDRIINVPEKLMEELYEYSKETHTLNEFRAPNPGMVFDFDKYYTKRYRPKLRAYDFEKWKSKYIQHAYDYFVYHVLKKHCIPALGHHVTTHQLRHTRATQLYDDKDIPIEIIQKLLGHRDIKTTMIYTEISNKKVFEAMKDID